MYYYNVQQYCVCGISLIDCLLVMSCVRYTCVDLTKRFKSVKTVLFSACTSKQSPKI